MIILEVSSKDKRISLGLKQTMEDPWDSIDDTFQVGIKLKGKVLHLLDKGIIFLLDNDFEGILPISKINEKDKDLFVINKEFDLSINQINKENRKIVLDYNLESENVDENVDEKSDGNEDIPEDNS